MLPRKQLGGLVAWHQYISDIIIITAGQQLASAAAPQVAGEQRSEFTLYPVDLSLYEVDFTSIQGKCSTIRGRCFPMTC